MAYSVILIACFKRIFIISEIPFLYLSTAWVDNPQFLLIE
uniref:Uncharacterized protein n=1 Tax=Siphoviridae sp. ctt0Q14 TaxID=2826489 RepID=A0A8S5QVQ8_9CAUD|nr:MAG TPA: hypothetical protein [Siphoviridae sp. ctt0Q14]DAJ33964.1 MAG TPA: hypothetical protein [Caudoviricetes sp.]DAM42819.1 MAG TPA: hypothetical protein [Caudoviricetes sp.]DAN26810.1 MAG TPA: hypothetical protein [Caudoviricetes sp.]DAU54181.1 MAG TPA: hypothetical protein [Caudoviricetes sp.]